ncbi:xanthine dehydrogenase family protein molybdopterin-binding subunit [Algoriphagus aestuariicola]|uniref:Xanthine dehydrogenase family protein molybdopterin-binding subunit n=1 Tax=Algoriphagus aestuariicola TaxID=1852016 RepID=A0ABS3BJV2_9BACT|nr:molybdopterin cofactor-binding domain-containing protein [Algoriphagus aestuariicola]MBN7799587.1 xanthine dehydrogenase family protein molybdopterin-binding subunit [Algoriphagus aestuariicola]
MMPNLPFLKKKQPEDRSEIFRASRRDFLKIGSLAAGGLVLGVNFQCSGPKGELVTFAPNVFVSIGSDNLVTILAHRSEMGTGIRTSLPMIVADELGADWSKVKIVQAEGDESKYGNQNTDGSFSVRMFYEPMKKAGATARHMLMQAAAKEWGVDVAECDTENSHVVLKGGSKKIPFGDLVAQIQTMELPKAEDVPMKDFSSYKLVGKDIPIYDVKDIATGNAVFGADVNLPNMLIAVVQRSPVVGAKVVSYNDEKALAIPGVKKVVKIEGPGLPAGLDKPLEGVAVLAENTWAAIKGSRELEIEWDLGPNQSYDSAVQLEEMVKSTTSNGTAKRERGNFSQAKSSSGKVIEKTYLAPFYAHSTIEPPAAIADVKADGSVEVWAPSQHPQWARDAVSAALGIDVSKVKMNVTLLGGGFGRKSKPDFVAEAALLSKAAGVPVRVQWTRECDLHHDYYHSHSAQRIVATLDGSGNLTGWNHHTVFPAIGSGLDAAPPSDGELDLGCRDFPYEVPNIRIESHETTAHTRIGWLRSVSNIHHAFAICTMLDEIAETKGVDPVDQALQLLGEDKNLTFAGEMVGDYGNYGEKIEDFPWSTARMKKVIETVAEKSNWKSNLAAGKAVGFAAHKSFLTYVACVVMVEKDANGNLVIPEVHYAVDCGIPVNTDRVRSQFEGGAQFATSLATTSAITLENGRVKQNNFDTYQIIRMSQAPKKIHVHIIPSMEKPTGVGEPPVPPFIPALANAVYKLTGKRNYQLPFQV